MDLARTLDQGVMQGGPPTRFAAAPPRQLLVATAAAAAARRRSRVGPQLVDVGGLLEKEAAAAGKGTKQRGSKRKVAVNDQAATATMEESQQASRARKK